MWKSPVDYAARSKAGIVAGLGDARAGRLHPPAAGEHARRFLFGLTAPFTLLRLAWRNPATRTSILDRLTIPVVLMGVALAIGVGALVQDLLESRHDPTALASQVDDDDDDDDRAPARKAADEKAGQAAAEAARSAALRARDEKKGIFEVASAAAAAAEAAEASEAAEQAQQAAAAPPPPPRAPRAVSPTRRAQVLSALGRFVESRLAKILAALGVLEWILVWIIREHHDVIALQVAELSGVPGEALAGPPRLRLDFGWLKLKAWRALRFLLFVALGSPPAWLLGATPVAGGALAAAWEAAWAAYWGCVFAVANTFLAWEGASAGMTGDGAPWFIRVLRPVARIPVVGWPVRLYVALLTKLTRAVWPACVAFEKAPWESAGLAVARFVAGIPALYLVCRPMFPPAATHALVARTQPPAGG